MVRDTEVTRCCPTADYSPVIKLDVRLATVHKRTLSVFLFLCWVATTQLWVLPTAYYASPPKTERKKVVT